MPNVPSKLVGFPLSDLNWIKGVLRGFRNGIITGTRIRLPYIIQAALYALIFQDRGSDQKLRFVIKQMFWHGRNLGFFVLLYKSICFALRHFGLRNGCESWIAGAVGGFWAFGDSSGVSGAVNYQIVLYLLVRGIEGSLKNFASKGIIPKQLDPSTPLGFRFLAAFSLALILFMTDHQENFLKKGFMDTMNFLYYESNSGRLLPSINFTPIVLVVAVSFLGHFLPPLTLENILTYFDRK